MSEQDGFFFIYLSLYFIFDFKLLTIMSSCEFREIFVGKGFKIENGVLGLDRDVYLNIVNFLDSSILRKV
jgi:hypothetical protein